MGIYFVAYLARPYCTDHLNRRYFFPALTVRILGALAIGFIYQFYYDGGDTYMYHTYGSRIIWRIFLESPWNGLRLLFANAGDYWDLYNYTSQIYFFRDSNSYTIIRLAAIFDLLTFSSYASTACFFAVIGFIGSWQFFLTFYKQYPSQHKALAVASLFIPSVAVWGSGILKDSVMLACVGIATYQFYLIFFERKYGVSQILILIISLWMIFSVKKFILQAYLPTVILWIGLSHLHKIRPTVLRTMLVPFVILILTASGYYAVKMIGEDDEKYAINRLASTARVTAYDIRYWSGRGAGSGYSLGELDGTFSTMLKLAPQAVNVSLFRPYLWEVRNPLMLLSALESFTLAVLVVHILLFKGSRVIRALKEPNVVFALTFAITFAFAVGISTFNFGTLARYKIPLLPFFATALVLIQSYEKSERKFSELETTEY